MKLTTPARFVVLANPDCRRLNLFASALKKQGFQPPVVIHYFDLLTRRVRLQDLVGEGDVVRLESPGRDWEVEKELLKCGTEATQQERLFNCLTETQVNALTFEKGRLWPSRQWFFGVQKLMTELGKQLKLCAPHLSTHSSADILTFFDKPLCHSKLQAAGIAVPLALPPTLDFEAFLANLQQVGWQRVFLKLAHGSSATGVVAFQTNGSRVKAVTTTEMVTCNGEIHLYSSRRLRTYETWQEVRQLIDALCRERVHIERWFSKASLHEKTCDARIVMIGGKVWGGITRLSRGPLTNLHLLNDRAPLSELRSAMREQDWDAMCASCEAAMALFPETHCAGVDVVFSPDFRRHAILEINAWGDLLPQVLVDGEDTYEAQQAELFSC